MVAVDSEPGRTGSHAFLDKPRVCPAQRHSARRLHPLRPRGVNGGRRAALTSTPWCVARPLSVFSGRMRI